MLSAVQAVAPVASRDDPLVGRVIGTGYEIRRLVGQGGMGSVYEAEQTSLARRVAVKLLKPDLLRDELSKKRFYYEARAASRLNHPNSVAVFDFGATDDGVPFIVMEYLSGKDLADVLYESGRLDAPRVCRIARAVLAALGEAHALGIYHRDMKPENVILLPHADGSEGVKVVDFGLAKLGLDAKLTDPNTVLGTPYYMAPEQFLAGEIDGRADLYSLGVVMFELLTGSVPFEGDAAVALAHQHLSVPPPDPRSLAPVDDQLADVVLRALRKKPSERFASALEMAQAIGRVTDVPAATSEAVRTRRRAGADTLPTHEPVVDELERAIVTLRAAPVVVLAGPVGSGRTTALAALAARCRRAGSHVASCTADVTGGAAYAPLRRLVEDLLGGIDAPDDARGLGLDPVERAGYAELLDPVGLRGVPNRSRAPAVAEAVAAVVRRVAARTRAGHVVLLFDDAEAYDALTLDAVERLASIAGDLASFVIAADEGGLAQRLVRAPRVAIGGRDARLPIHERLLRKLRFA
ncbi:MAG TPA: serine/threonine-protein kinase, partial [Minicystis sp.]|nr:serine/threonine-protein kinase [Minicystis sp.]